MALPKLETATYELVLPSTNEKIKFRPWLVKEQKVLMMAQESEVDEQIEQAFANIVSACTYGKIDPYESPLFDIEYIFLQLRSKSVGEKVKLILTMPSDGETKVEHELDLSKVQVQMEEEHSNIVEVTDDIKMVMRYPKLADMTNIAADGQIKVIFEMVKSCVDEIHDGKTIHNKVDMADKELEEFIESMSTEHFVSLSSFFETMPKLIHEIKVKHPKTKKQETIRVEGLRSFFD